MRSFLLLASLTIACNASDDPGTAAAPDATATPEASGDVAVNIGGCDGWAAECMRVQKGCVGAVAAESPRCELCPEGQAPTLPYAQCAPIPGELHLHDFGDITLEVGQEHDGWCQSWELNNAEELWVNAVEFRSGGGYHHSNWFFTPMGDTPLTDEKTGEKSEYPKGLWKGCYNQGFHEVDAALKGGVLFAQSTQVVRDLQKFSTGAAVRIPPWSRIIGATHLLNVYGEKRTTNLKMAIWTIPAADVTVKLSPFRLSYTDLAIPKGAKADYTGTCDFEKAYGDIAPDDAGPFALKLYYALPHYHKLGRAFRLAYKGGAKDGETIFEQGAFNPDPFGHVFDPPIDLAQGQGVTFTCGYDNVLDKDVVWGIGDNEMCVMLGFAASPLAFDATVGQTDTTETTGDVRKSQGACGVLAFPFLQDKEGGKAP